MFNLPESYKDVESSIPFHFDWCTEIDYSKSDAKRNSASFNMRQHLVSAHQDSGEAYAFTCPLRKTTKKSTVPSDDDSGEDNSVEHSSTDNDSDSE